MPFDLREDFFLELDFFLGDFFLELDFLEDFLLEAVFFLDDFFLEAGFFLDDFFDADFFLLAVDFAVCFLADGFFRRRDGWPGRNLEVRRFAFSRRSSGSSSKGRP